MAGAALLVAAVVLAGCQVRTTVAIAPTAAGSGAVSVTVSLDHSALSAVGGQGALAAELADSDLKAQGWEISGPKPGPGQTTTLTARHSYSNPAQAALLVADLAGSGPAGSRPFRLQLSRHHSFWHTVTSLSGVVDLRCGLDCFGDGGLRSVLGYQTGVNPSPLLGSSAPGAVFTFSLQARLRGSIKASDATSRTGGLLGWTPALGGVTDVSATAESWNAGSLTVVAVPAGLVAATLLLVGWFRLTRARRRVRRRDRRRRGSGAGSGARSGAGSGGSGEAVTPSS